jgi:glycerol-3-phosphate acyltransferase PlsX
MVFMMTKIAIEATGSDNGIEVVLEGAKKYLEAHLGLEIILIAGEDKLMSNPDIASRLVLSYDGPEGKKYTLDGIPLETSKYTYDSTQNGKSRIQSSIFKAMEKHKNKEVDAVIAPGDTRGAVFYACKVLELMSKVKDPAIPTHWPNNNVLIDSGANSESTPENLYQSAIMGHVFSKYYLGVESPLIGLLTNGKEGNKGNRFIRESRRLIRYLKNHGYNLLFPEYFEGNFFEDSCPNKVVVTDGHTGNILLKGCEGAVKEIFKTLKEEVMNQPIYFKIPAKIGLKRPAERIKKISYESYAAAPLLGVNGNVMICHGKSDAEAIANAIMITDKYLKCHVNDKLREEIEKYGDPRYQKPL